MSTVSSDNYCRRWLLNQDTKPTASSVRPSLLPLQAAAECQRWVAHRRKPCRTRRRCVTPGDTYAQLVAFLDQHGARYRLIDHVPEGRTDIVSPMRGNALSQAAKCLVLMVKLGKKVTTYVLAVVPGDAFPRAPAAAGAMRRGHRGGPGRHTKRSPPGSGSARGL